MDGCKIYRHWDVTYYFFPVAVLYWEDAIADEDATTADGRTLLMHACAQCDVERHRVADIVKYLVDELRADLTAVDHHGRTALYHAVESGQLDAATYLLGRPPSRQCLVNVDGRSLLVAAVQAGRPEVVSLLLESSSIGRQLTAVTDASGRGPVHHWVTSLEDSTPDEKSRRSAVLLDLVAHRCDVNSAWPSLRGCDVNAADNDGVTPLMLASGAGRAAAVAALLQLRDGATSSVEVDAVDSVGRTALHHCCASVPPSLRCCRALVRSAANANVDDASGVTPLMLACQAYVPGANVAVIRYLVEKGSADPVKQDSEGRDSYDYCPPIDSQYVRAVLRSASGIYCIR